MNVFYSKKIIIKYLLMFLGLVVAMKATTGIGIAVLIPFILMAITHNRPEKLMFYMLLLISMVVANPILAPRGTVFFIIQRMMFAFFGFILMIKVAGQGVDRVIKSFSLMIVYILFMIIPSTNGWAPIVSYLKLILFTVIYFAFYGMANSAATSHNSSCVYMRSVVLAIAIPFIFGSIALIPFPGIGMMSYEELMKSEVAISLFRGFTNHSQCLGPVISCLGIMLYSDLLFGIGKPDKLYVALLVCCPYLIWKTGSRTALGTMMAGYAFATYFFLRTRGVNKKWKSKIVSVMLILSIVGSAALIFTGAGKGMKKFIAKRNYDENNIELSVQDVASSRSGLVDEQIYYFKQKPLVGNGFQVSSEMQYMNTEHWTSLLSAPVEKGVWVTAVLEEGGAIGLGLFLFFLGAVFTTLLRHRAYVGASTLFVFVVLNFGEFTMFSMSYAGGFCWAITFAALTLDSVRRRDMAMARTLKF